MNPLSTFYEVWKNRHCLSAYDGGEYKIYEIRTDKLRVKGRKWREMDQFYRRKFENLLVLSEPKQKLKFHYV